MNASNVACLPYPTGINVKVFKDDGNWEAYRSWWMRPLSKLRELAVAEITLRHFEGEDEPAYSHAEWIRKSKQLVEKYPNCIFVY